MAIASSHNWLDVTARKLAVVQRIAQRETSLARKKIIFILAKLMLYIQEF